MLRATSDDLYLLDQRLRLGIPLTGFDGCAIPLRDPVGGEVDPIDAAHTLLRSVVGLLPVDALEAYVDHTVDRAKQIEAAAVIAGDSPDIVTAKVTGVLVSAAVRASMMATAASASPSDLNRATLSWYRIHELLRRQLLDASAVASDRRLSA